MHIWRSFMSHPSSHPRIKTTDCHVFKFLSAMVPCDHQRVFRFLIDRYNPLPIVLTTCRIWAILAVVYNGGSTPHCIIGKWIIELVSFISIEDDPPDLILSFAIWQPELDDIRSLILLRTPEYEFILDETERCVKFSVEAFLDDEDVLLKEIEFGAAFVRINTYHHQFDLDLRKVDKEEIEQEKSFLKRMNFDNRFEIRIVK